VQAHADALRGLRTMEAVLSIDRALQLEPYREVDQLESRVRAFPREVVLGIWDALLTTPPEQLTATAEAILPRIAAPLLSLHGSPPPAGYESWIMGLVRGARVEIWEGAGHMLQLVQPERFVARVRPLLKHPSGALTLPVTGSGSHTATARTVTQWPLGSRLPNRCHRSRAGSLRPAKTRRAVGPSGSAGPIGTGSMHEASIRSRKSVWAANGLSRTGAAFHQPTGGATRVL
jgi:hypothetical protein